MILLDGRGGLEACILLRNARVYGSYKIVEE